MVEVGFEQKKKGGMGGFMGLVRGKAGGKPSLEERGRKRRRKKGVEGM